MADVLCPVCGRSNPAELEDCQFCGARLTPHSDSTPVVSQPIQDGENPAGNEPVGFGEVEPANVNPVQSGEVPSTENPSGLEPRLPSWLSSLRDGQGTTEGFSAAEPSLNQDLPLNPAPDSNPDPSGELTGWLSGLAKATSGEEDEIPDWLVNLRGEEKAHFCPFV